MSVKHETANSLLETDGKAVKRRRQDLDRQQRPVPLPHLQLSFDDGNVLILSEDTSFRVHRTQLTRKSRYFDAFLASAEDTDDRGCLVFRSDEPGADIAVFLHVLYNGWK